MARVRESVGEGERHQTNAGIEQSRRTYRRSGSHAAGVIRRPCPDNGVARLDLNVVRNEFVMTDIYVDCGGCRNRALEREESRSQEQNCGCVSALRWQRNLFWIRFCLHIWVTYLLLDR